MIKILDSYSLLPHNTFGIDAKTDTFVEFKSEEALLGFLGEGYHGLSLVIGGGSNLLFAGDFHGTVFHSAIKGYEVVGEDDEHIFLRVGSGVNWDELVEYTVSQGWGGLENLSAIPGEAGASAVQNVGAYGVESGDLITEVETIAIADASRHVFMHDECDFSYRHSIFKATEKGKHIITYVTYKLDKSPKFRLTYGNLAEKLNELGGATLANVRRAVCEIRDAKLPSPSKVGSAGSFFMNPVVPVAVANNLSEQYPAMPKYPLSDGDVKLSAGWLIEQCGWKQTPHERVGVYEHQALVIINRGGATGENVLNFASAVVNSVKEKFGVELKMEVNVIK